MGIKAGLDANEIIWKDWAKCRLLEVKRRITDVDDVTDTSKALTAAHVQK